MGAPTNKKPPPPTRNRVFGKPGFLRLSAYTSVYLVRCRLLVDNKGKLVAML